MNKPTRIIILLSIALIFLSIPFYAQSYSEGSSYYGRNDYIEYLCGGLPLIISVPHGGGLTPSEIPDRTCGATVRDSYTLELSMELSDAIYNITGRYPHLIINNLKRIKLDANRDMAEATCNDAIAAISWGEYHNFIDSARLYVNNDYAKGLFIDMHGQSSHGERIELGYLVTGAELRLDDATLNTAIYQNKSSIKSLISSNVSSLSYSELLRGTSSLGTMLEGKGYYTIPSTNHQSPVDDFYSGGYNTQRHGSKNGGTIDGIQIEHNREIRFNEVERQTYASHLATVLLTYLKDHYFPDLESYYDIGSSVDNVLPADIKYYPNPVTDILHIETLAPTEIQIINLLGQEVYSRQLNAESDISLGHLGRGLNIIVFKQRGIVIGRGKLFLNTDR